MKISFLFYKIKKYLFEFNGKVILYGLSVLMFSFSAFANPVLATDKQWLKLLRYNKTLFGYKSEVDYSGYFFSKDGKTKPLEELNATILNFNKNSSEYKDINKHPICMFPGRYLYLQRKIKGFKQFDLKNCEEYQKFKTKIKLNSVSLIFSSFYINKPASAFGHTLLKLNSEDPLKSDLRSYGVDFSAQVTTHNPFLYGVMGIMGGFYGQFSLMPYFIKMREYNDYESRDLWELELNLSIDDKELLLAHLWDMNLALFDYYYFSENCSYHVLRLIDAIKPDWNLIDDLYSTVIPVDTLVPLLKNKDYIQSIYYRPSLYKRVLSGYKALNDKQKQFLKKSVDALKIIHQEFSSSDEKAKTYDTLIDFMDYKFSKDIYLASKNEKIKDFKREVLIQRSELAMNQKSLLKYKKDSLDIGHFPRRLGLGKSFGDRRKTFISSRTALHDVLEPEGDIYSNFSLEMNKFNFYVNDNEEKKKLYLSQYEFAHVLALRPLMLIEKKISWEFSLGLKNHSQYENRIGSYLNLGVGPSFDFNDYILYSFLYTDFSHLFAESVNKQSLYGINTGVVKNYKNLGLSISYKILKDFDLSDRNYHQIDFKSSYNFSKNWATSLDYASYENYKTYSIYLNYRY